MNWLLDAIIGFALGAIPTWAWVVAAGVALGGAWRWFGWQGILGGLLAILAIGAYRQGWRDRDGRDADVIGKHHPGNVDDVVIGRVPKANPPLRKKRRTVMDILSGR